MYGDNHIATLQPLSDNLRKAETLNKSVCKTSLKACCAFRMSQPEMSLLPEGGAFVIFDCEY